MMQLPTRARAARLPDPKTGQIWKHKRSGRRIEIRNDCGFYHVRYWMAHSSCPRWVLLSFTTLRKDYVLETEAPA